MNKLRGRRFARPQKKNKAIERRERFRQPSWFVPGLYNTRPVKRRREGLLTCVHSARHLENGLNARALIGSGVHKRGTSIRQKKTDPHTSKSAVQHERHSSCPFSDTPEMRRRFDCPSVRRHTEYFFSLSRRSPLWAAGGRRRRWLVVSGVHRHRGGRPGESSSEQGAHTHSWGKRQQEEWFTRSPSLTFVVLASEGDQQDTKRSWLARTADDSPPVVRALPLPSLFEERLFFLSLSVETAEKIKSPCF